LRQNCKFCYNNKQETRQKTSEPLHRHLTVFTKLPSLQHSYW